MFLTTILLWWQGFTLLEDPTFSGGAGPLFLVLLLFFLILYLCCAFALPDPDWERSSGSSEGNSKQEVDLEAFYFSAGHRRWFFGLLIGFWVTAGAVNQFTFESGNATERLVAALPIAGIAAFLAVPILTGRRWAHWIVVVGYGGLIGATAVTEILL